jgi:hypothetical protein
VTTDEAVLDALLAAIRERDFERIETCFAPDARLRVLTPHQVRDLTGAEDATGRYRAWLETLDPFELLEGDVDGIADRVRIRYRFRGHDPAKGWQLNEHTGYAAVVDGRVSALNVTCTGFRPTPAP